MAIGQMTWIALANVRPLLACECNCYLTRLSPLFLVLDLRSKFSAIHREYSPNPRKFYAFTTSVTDTATTAGIIASGELFGFIFIK
jgi:hypothetical protein